MRAFALLAQPLLVPTLSRDLELKLKPLFDLDGLGEKGEAHLPETSPDFLPGFPFLQRALSHSDQTRDIEFSKIVE